MIVIASANLFAYTLRYIAQKQCIFTAVFPIQLSQSVYLFRESKRIQYRFFSTDLPDDSNVERRQLYEDFVQQKLKDENKIKMPLVVYRFWLMFKKRFFRKRDTLNPEFRCLLDKSASQLYYKCAVSSIYLPLCKEFELPDLFTSWFKLTLMHVWMVLFRLHVSLDAESYQRLHHSILTTLWEDVDKRIQIIDTFTRNTSHSYKDMKQVHALFIQTFFEYDEGYLSDDRNLAGAVWRNLYLEESFNPIAVANVVRYLRATIADLSNIHIDDLLVNGIEKWEAAEEIKEFQNI